jgi:ABC-type lipoprotein export system ATPase subunit
LLAILGLLDSPSGGEYTLRGQPVASLKAAERARIRNREIGFIFRLSAGICRKVVLTGFFEIPHLG